MRRAILLACCLAPTAALAAGANDPWLRMTSANFELFTTAGERSGRDLVRHFEQVRSFFVQVFHAQAAGRPSRIIAFRSEKEYEPYKPNNVASAFFQGGRAHDFIVMSSASSEHYHVAVHEYTHLLLRQTGVELPVWLNEGVAELYSNLEPQGSKILVGRVIPSRRRSLVSDQWIPLRTLLAVRSDSPFYNERSRAGMFYAESWLLVHMLQMNSAYSGVLAAMTEALKTSDGVAAFEKASRRTVDQVERDLQDYRNSPTMAARLFNVQLPKSVDAPEIETKSGFLARLALAELLASWPGKGIRAQAAYNSLMHEFPDRWEAHAGLAEMQMRDRKDDLALYSFGKAALLGSSDAHMYVEYGKLLDYSKRNGEALAALQKAVTLDPSWGVAHFELAAAQMRAGNYLEALKEFAALEKTSKLPIEYGSRLVYNLAYTHYRLGQLAQARKIIEDGRRLIRNPDEVAAIERLARALDSQ